MYKLFFVIRDVMHLEQLEQAEALFKPQRIEVLRRLAEPHTCGEVAEQLGQTPQRVYYHVKRLVEAGLVTLVEERKVRGVHEGIYQATPARTGCRRGSSAGSAACAGLRTS